MSAREQVARLLTLVPYLQRRGEVRLEDAAAALGVNEEQLVKDLRVLLMCGLPGGYPDDLIDVDFDALFDPSDTDDSSEFAARGDGVIRISNADYLSRPVKLTATEATALVVALRALRSSAEETTAPIVDRAMAKLESAAADGAAAAAQIDPGAGSAAEAELRSTLSSAIAADRQVLLDYWVPSRDERAERVVDPVGIITGSGVEYLDAWCHRAEARRSFRLDRIHAARALDSIRSVALAPSKLPPGFLSQSARSTTAVTLSLAPEAAWVPEYYATSAVRPHADGTMEIDMLIGDEQWLERLLLRLAPHATVISPAGLNRRHVESARQTLTLYSGASTVEY
ncbi:MAG: helix-turn-helix transcriptional regulator [Nocardioides sp.]